ncbi:hypothetical protein R1sor_003701 [Riccia sorocarpa]|uniref:procollagen-proline 4-dioxygenase n=1 Tax=Riccia sorocarpa TaxID=122646 RepID=A0ABD3H584_9MARC
MKGHKPRPGRGCGYALPLPIAVLMCSAFFFLGYYVSLSNNQEIVVENDVNRINRQKLLENGEGVLAEYGVTGDDKLNIIPFQVLSWKPRALLFPGFANKLQCETIIALAKTRLSPSGLALRKGESVDATKDVRTSSGTFLSSSQDKTGTLRWVEERMAKATMIPKEHGEAFNVLRYEIGQKYNSHYDVFNPAEYGPQKSQRMASFLLYLSDVEEGGETMFPFENYQNMNIGYDYKQCMGLRVKPKQGDALLFYSMFPNGTFDAAALHGSCPVASGEKWVATKWIRDSMDR